MRAGPRGANAGLERLTAEDIKQLFSNDYERQASKLGIRPAATVQRDMRRPAPNRAREFNDWVGYLEHMEGRDNLSVNAKRATYNTVTSIIDQDIVKNADASCLKQLQLLKLEIAIQNARLDQF